MTGKKDASAVVTTTYVAYLLPGSFFSEESVHEVASRNPDEDIKNAHEYAFALFYFDIVKTIVKVGEERVETSSGRRNISHRHYIGGEILDIEAVEALGSEYDTVVRNMKGNDWDKVIRCRTGNFQPFEDEDVLLTVS